METYAMRKKTYQVLRFDGPPSRSFVNMSAFLRFRLASKAAIVNFEICRRKQ